MNKVLDKKLFWTDLVDDLSDQIDSGFYFSLRKDAYIDRIEPEKVVVALASEGLQRQCEKKYRFKIKDALSKALGRKLDVLFVYGPPRIYAKVANQKLAPEERLKALHQTHGDIMGIVDGDTLLSQVSKPIEQGGWGIYPQVLTNACKDYGVLAVQDGLASVANSTKVKNARGFFDAALKRGDFGEKLTGAADVLGLKHNDTMDNQQAMSRRQ